MRMRRTHSTGVVWVALTLVTLSSIGLGQSEIRDAEQGPIKCGTAWRMNQIGHVAGVGGEKGLSEALDRPVLHTYRSSPGGNFRIHFDTLGANEPALLDASHQRLPGTAGAYVDSLGVAFERSRDVIVTQLGYDAPPAVGGDSFYDIYVMNLSSDLFGETQFESEPFQTSPNLRYHTWIVIDNDFSTQRTRGLRGAYVTAAHEYFHAVQVGSYGVWATNQFYWYEISSTWMEEIVFPGLDDYLFDVARYFQLYGTTSLLSQSALFPGYERAVFGHFLSEYLGEGSIRRIWERIREQPTTEALVLAFADLGTTLESVYARFASWNYYTADRADAGRSYKRGADFPRLNPLVESNLIGDQVAITYGFSPLSHGLFSVRTGTDTVFILVSNLDRNRLRGGLGVSGTPKVVLSRGAQQGPSQSLVVGLTGGFEDNDQTVWDIEYFSSASGGVIARTDLHPFPNPWRLSQPYDLIIPVSAAEGASATVSFIAADLRSVDGGEYQVTNEKGETVVRVSVAEVGHRLGSGAYVVLIRVEDDHVYAKVTVVR